MEGYAENIARLLYERTNEKEKLSSWLTERLAGRTLEHTLDIGPGPGLISAPLAAASRRLTMVEKNPVYTAVLREKFPQATVLAESIEDWDARGHDFVLFSHGLYYHPVDQWVPLCQKLCDGLLPGGELVVVLNADSGDWWRILEECDYLRPHWTFNYRPASAFGQELGALVPVETIPLHCTISFSERDQMREFIGKQAMLIVDDDVFEANLATFDRLVDGFVAKNGALTIELDSYIFSVRASKPMPSLLTEI